jgi:hypothetical protein
MGGGIEPILHFHLPLHSPPSGDELKLLFQTYAEWGVNYVTLFNRPNRRRAWSAKGWAQNDLVERFIDIYLPLAEACLAEGLTPVFPPLEPGGDYWDTAFLRTALVSIGRRGHARLLRKLVLGAYAWADNRPLSWGGGGPERWPGARPYLTPPGEEDHRGFRIFDWYLAIAQAVLGHKPAMILLGMGSHIDDQVDPQRPSVDSSAHAERNLTIARLIMRDPPREKVEPPHEAVPVQVLAGNFWLLAASPQSPHQPHAWFKPEGDSLPVTGALRQWMAGWNGRPGRKTPGHGSPTRPNQPIPHSGKYPISRYLLLPSYDWGVADWHLEVIRPYIKKYQPTVGFSLTEARHARHVTVVGGIKDFPEAELEMLRTSGSFVERIDGDGTSIASQLAEA